MNIFEIKIIFGLLFGLISCSDVGDPAISSEVTTSHTEMFNDTRTKRIRSGFYLIVRDTFDVVTRRLFSVTKKDLLDGDDFNLSTNDCLPFDKIDSVYIQYSEYTRSFGIYFRFLAEGQKQLYDLTNRSSYPRYIAENGRQKFGTLINDTLVQVVSIMEPIDSEEITLSGIFDKETATGLKRQIDREISGAK